MEIVFSVTQEADAGFVAECLSHDIFTQADNWELLRKNVQEAVSAYFFDQPKPARETFKARELAAMTDEQARQIIQRLAAPEGWRERPDWSGLVEQQAIFHKRRSA